MKDNEIKIRVWDKGDKQMKYADLEYFDDMIGFRFDHRHMEEDDNSDIVFMLSSTVYDDLNKELWLGDIFTNNAAKWEVVFNQGCFCGKLLNGPDRDMHLALRAIKGKIKIGNIYENPELLQK